MKTGDLVNFYCDAWVFSHVNDRYKNPGIILDKQERKSPDHQPSYKVLWTNKKITSEHACYLKLIE